MGIKTTQYSVLCQMLVMGCPRPGDLAVSMRMAASTLSRNLRPLRAAGWITVGPGKDNRSRCVFITPDGRLKQQEASGYWRIAQMKLDERLGRERVLALHTLIDEVLVRLGNA
ncbi:MarR family winged helix-turn-helix transcriptional regulator [Variovorax sp. E3]|uniref:MarR family winged helix-turn-helix transcriptional regulator n=1 Tax=Variovorax sp. E3 TaxID=1914993 RepID=UPI0027DE51B1|nr:MarR family winged helix-turn-helix transcriptional regulator [Variovorax sp. E3]